MAFKQLIKFGAVALGQTRSMSHVAVGNFQQLCQIVAFKLLLGVSKR